MKRFSDFNVTAPEKTFDGEKIKIFKILNREIKVLNYRLVDSKFKQSQQRLDLHIELDGAKYIVFTGSVNLIKMITQIEKVDLPFLTVIEKDGESFKFT
jgi:hypothetical protein